MAKRRPGDPSRSGVGLSSTDALLLEQHEAALRLAAIVNSSDDAIVSKTLEGIIVSWNPAAERMFGWAAGEVIGKSITIIIPPDRLDEEENVLAQLRRGQTIDHYETMRIRKDGVAIPISLTVSPVRDPSGAIVGASKIARDISDRRRVEEERARLLTQERAARQEAERASRVKDEFLATLSHELRTPLTSIMGWVRMLRQRTLDGDAAERALEIVDRNAQSLKHLVEDILDISSITMGRFRLESVPVDLPSVVRAAVDAVRHAANAKNIRLDVFVDPRVRPVAGDAGRLQQVVWNLVSNAVKFTPDGGHVEVSLAPSGSYAEIRVRDDGQGIAADFAPRLFEPFSQQDASTTRHHGGLGMGLAIVRHLVEVHGGTVSAESAGPGQGATFIVRLPQVLGRLTRVEKPEVDTLTLLGGLHVLAVEDEPDTRELIATVLRQAGADVAVAASVDEALGVLTTSAPDVVLCDIAMPGRDGYELLREARRRPALARTPFVALTAHVQETDRRRTLAEGFEVHLPKPVDPVELVEVVRTISGR
ncbi:MAG TPA: ATP-binding protein [Methylomirabilota bacterium]|nr:ATP-binding protein [Methylomirabilota bacterium]